MKITKLAKSLAVAAVMAVSATGTLAQNLVQNVTLTPNLSIPGNYTAGFTAAHVLAGNFTDIFNFLPNTVGGNVTGSLVTITLLDPYNIIDFTTANINGAAFTFTETVTGGIRSEVGLLTFAPNLAAPLILTVAGIAGPGLPVNTAIAAQYSGTTNVSIPEPATLGLLGLGLVGFGIARRRKQK